LPQSNTAIEPSPGLSTQRIAALAAGGIGVIGVAVGTVFGLKTMSNQSVAEKYCVDTTCSDQRGVTAGNDAHSAGNVATIGMVVGAVGLTTGLTLWFTASNGRSSTDVGIGPGTVHVEGVW
jgi:hypothetical protein